MLTDDRVTGPGKPPRVSIVTISFNQRRFLERALVSVLDQDYPDVEYIVVDPGSSDGSNEVIGRYRDRIATLIETPDAGPADGLNKGFAAATGDIFGYINADDALLPGALTSAVRAFADAPAADVVVGHGYIVDSAGTVIRRFRSAPFGTRRFAYGASTVMQQSTFFRRAAFERTAGFNVENRTSWDGELLLEMALAGARVKLVNQFWSLFTLHSDSISGSQRRASESLFNHRRYFERVMRRSPRARDAALRRGYWALRWASDPVGAWQRLSDRLFGPPQLGAL